jgi:hypothetical protein
MSEKFNYREYRDDLAEEIKQEPDKDKRWDILENARETNEFKVAKEEKMLERYETSIEERYPDIIAEIRGGFPKYAERLNGLKFFEFPDIETYKKIAFSDGNEGDYTAFYLPESHRIFAVKDLVPNEKILPIDISPEMLTKFKMLHELTHAISYRCLDELPSAVNVGVQKSVLLEDGKIKNENFGLNEALTNFFAFRVFPEIARNPEDIRKINELRKTSGVLTIPAEIANVVGIEVLEKAYFDGDVEGLRMALNKKGINGSTIFSLMEQRGGGEVLKMLSKSKRRKR